MKLAYLYTKPVYEDDEPDYIPDVEFITVKQYNSSRIYDENNCKPIVYEYLEADND